MTKPYKIKMHKHIRQHVIALMKSGRYTEPESGPTVTARYSALSCYVGTDGRWRFSVTGLLCESAVADGVAIFSDTAPIGVFGNAMLYDNLAMACPNAVADWAGSDPVQIDGIPAPFKKAIAALREREP